MLHVLTATKQRLTLNMVENEKLIRKDDTCACVVDTLYNLVIRSEDLTPIPEGTIYIFLRRVCLPNEPIYRCEKHVVDGNQNVIACHSSNVSPAKVKMSTNGKYLLGVKWKLGTTLESVEECQISFKCTNFDVSRAHLDRKWRMDIRKSPNIEHHEIISNFNFVSVHRKLHYAVKILDSYPTFAQRLETTEPFSVAHTNEIGTQTDQSDPQPPVNSDVANVLATFKELNDQFASLLGRYQTVHYELIQMRESISSLCPPSTSLIALEEELPQAPLLMYDEFDALLNL